MRRSLRVLLEVRSARHSLTTEANMHLRIVVGLSLRITQEFLLSAQGQVGLPPGRWGRLWLGGKKCIRERISLVPLFGCPELAGAGWLAGPAAAPAQPSQPRQISWLKFKQKKQAQRQEADSAVGEALLALSASRSAGAGLPNGWADQPSQTSPAPSIRTG